MELAFDDFAAVTNLNLELSVVADGLQHCLIFQNVPLVDVRAVASVVSKESQVELEASHFVDHRADVLVGELRDWELVVQEAIPEHQVLPHVDFLVN